MTSASIVLLVLMALLLWRVYTRVRRLVGRQRSTLRRHWLSLLVFSLLTLMLALGTRGNTIGLSGLAAGLASGAALAWWGLRLTRFDVTPQGYFYTPNAHIGIALSLLFVGRILYRMVGMFGMQGIEAQGVAQNFVRSPLTLVAFGLLAGYYVVYAAGMLRWRRRARMERLQATASAGEAVAGPG